MEFIESEKETADVFCFQEMYDTSSDVKNNINGTRANLFFEIQQRLPEFIGYMATTFNAYDLETVDGLGKVDYDLKYGLASFVKNTIKVEDQGQVMVHRGIGQTDPEEIAYHPRNLQYLDVIIDDRKLRVCNFHGLWSFKYGKKDFPDRINQSNRIKEFLDKTVDPKILVGDFNLEPDTRSLAILEENMVDLIKTYGITTTRSSYCDKPVKFADYALVSPDIEIVDFQVPNVLASDHLPLILEIK